MEIKKALAHFQIVVDQHQCPDCKCALETIRAALAESTNSSHNSAMVPCEAHIGAGYDCGVITSRKCKKHACLVCAQHQ